jgi:hypothetical protein
MNQYEVPACIEDEFPEIRNELKMVAPSGNVFKTLQCLAGYTRRMIAVHNYRAVRKSFLLAEKIYNHGNTVVKNAIENVFVYSFSAMLNRCEEQEVPVIHAMMPLSLYSAYVRQMLKSGI